MATSSCSTCRRRRPSRRRSSGPWRRTGRPPSWRREITSSMARKKIGEILIEEGVLDETRLRAALVEQQRWGGPLGRLLVDMKLIDERTLVDALSRQLHIPQVDLDAIEIPRAVMDLVPGELAEQHSVMPFGQPMKFLDL